MPAKVGALPANLLVGDVFRREYIAIGVDSAAFMACCYEGVEKIVFVQCVVEVHLVGQLRIAFLCIVQGLRDQRNAVEKKLRNTARGKIGLEIARTDLY